MAENTRRFRYTGFITAILLFFFGSVIQWQFSDLAMLDKSVTYQQLEDFQRRHATALAFDWLQWTVLVAVVWMIRLFWIKEYNVAASNKSWKAPIAAQPTSPNQRGGGGNACRTDKFPDFTRTRTDTLEKFSPKATRGGKHAYAKSAAGVSVASMSSVSSDGRSRGRSVSRPPASCARGVSRSPSPAAASHSFNPPNKGLPPVPVPPRGETRRTTVSVTSKGSEYSQTHSVVIPIANLGDDNVNKSAAHEVEHEHAASHPSQGDVGLSTDTKRASASAEKADTISEVPRKSRSFKRKSYKSRRANSEVPPEHSDQPRGNPFSNKTQPVRSSMASPGLCVAARVHVWESRDSSNSTSVSRSQTSGSGHSARANLSNVARVSTAPQTQRVNTTRPRSKTQGATSSSTMGRMPRTQQMQQKSALTHMRHYSSSKSKSVSTPKQGDAAKGPNAKPPVPFRRKTFRRPPVKPARPPPVVSRQGSGRSMRRKQRASTTSVSSVASEAAAAVHRRSTRKRPPGIWDRPRIVSVSEPAKTGREHSLVRDNVEALQSESATREEDLPPPISRPSSPPRISQRPNAARMTPPATPTRLTFAHTRTPFTTSRGKAPLTAKPSFSSSRSKSMTAAPLPPRPRSLPRGGKSILTAPPKPPSLPRSMVGRGGASSLFNVETFSTPTPGSKGATDDDVENSGGSGTAAAAPAPRGSESNSHFSGAITIADKA